MNKIKDLIITTKWKLLWVYYATVEWTILKLVKILESERLWWLISKILVSLIFGILFSPIPHYFFNLSWKQSIILGMLGIGAAVAGRKIPK